MMQFCKRIPQGVGQSPRNQQRPVRTLYDGILQACVSQLVPVGLYCKLIIVRPAHGYPYPACQVAPVVSDSL